VPVFCGSLRAAPEEFYDLLRGVDRSTRIERSVGRRNRHGRAGLRKRVQGADGRSPLSGPDGRTDTGMPVAVRRAVITRTGTAEAAGSGQRNARIDRRRTEALDVISVSPVPAGPFGQDLRYVGADGRVNGLVHELRVRTGETFHDLAADVDDAWTKRWTTVANARIERARLPAHREHLDPGQV
jgi:hypothetical protein